MNNVTNLFTVTKSQMKHSGRFRNVELKTRERNNVNSKGRYKEYSLFFIFRDLNISDQGDIRGLLLGYTDRRHITLFTGPLKYWGDAFYEIKEHSIPISEFSIGNIIEHIKKMH